LKLDLIYWIGIPLLIGFVWWLIELRARRERRHYAFPPRARAIHDALRSGSELRVVYWSKAQGRFASNDVVPVGISGFYFNARDKATGEMHAYKITRIKELLPLASGVPVVSEAMPVERKSKHHRRHQRSYDGVYLFAAILVVTVAVLVLIWREKQALHETEEGDAHEEEVVSPVAVITTQAVTAAAEPVPDDVWNVVLHIDARQTDARWIRLLQQEFGYPREIATKMVGDLRTLKRMPVWSGKHDEAISYVVRLKGDGVNAVLEKAKP